jgi:hypothetical protein
VNQGQNVNFEERLLAELRAVVEERAAMPAFQAPATPASEEARTRWSGGPAVTLGGPGGGRLAPRLVVGGAAVAAVAAAVLAVSSGTGDTSSAFAVEPRGNGEVRVEISSLSDAQGLEKALEEAGIKADVNYLPAGMVCREPRFTPSGGAPERTKSSNSVRQTDSGVVFTITRSGIDPGDTLLVTATPPGPEGTGDTVGVQIAEGAVSACDSVPATEALPPGAVTQSNGVPGGGVSQRGLQQSAPQTTGPQQGLTQSSN